MATDGARWGKDGTECQRPFWGDAVGLTRRGTLGGGAFALAAAFGLVGCSVDPMSEVLPVVAEVPVPTPQANTELRELVEGAGDLVVAGVPLNAGLLKRFYGRHAFQPVWADRREQAEALVAAVLRAGEHGLSPELFHGAALQDGGALPALQRELLLSDAFLAFADALARGAVPVERRKADQVLAPEPVDVAAVLDQAARSQEPAGVIEALAPTTPTYVALREALKAARLGEVAPGKAEADRVRTIEVNLERERWLPRPLPADRTWVNVADERLVLYRAGEAVFSTRVVVGEDVEKNQSPEFRAAIDASFYNPPWVIPADIAKAEILPKVGDDPDYLQKNGMVLLAGGEVEQLPGPEAGLGYIMFDMPNRFDVYLHDTPDRAIFARENRRISHGCIRVQNPRDFAALLMDKPIEAIDQGIAAGNTTRNDLVAPVPVFVVYQTAFVDAGGALQFRPDFYKRDGAIWRGLHGGAEEPGVVVPARVARPRVARLAEGRFRYRRSSGFPRHRRGA